MKRLKRKKKAAKKIRSVARRVFARARRAAQKGYQLLKEAAEKILKKKAETDDGESGDGGNEGFPRWRRKKAQDSSTEKKSAEESRQESKQVAAPATAKPTPAEIQAARIRAQQAEQRRLVRERRMRERRERELKRRRQELERAARAKQETVSAEERLFAMAEAAEANARRKGGSSRGLSL